MAKVREEFYHGWTICITQQQAGYAFQCWIAEHELNVTDAQHYLTFEQALSAARLRADLECVRLSLTNFLRGKLNLSLLFPGEQNALENSIAQYINTAKPLS